MENNRNDGKITAHMVVKNEDQWVWFSIMSVIDYVDKILIFDTGSIDKTVDVINTIAENSKYKEKVYFEKVGSVSPKEFYKIHQKQIEMTETEYMMVVDGDEIWWKESFNEIHNIIKQSHPYRISTKFIVPCTDLYHYRGFEREHYLVDQIQGSITTRVISMNIDGLSCSGDYGVEGYSGYKGGLENYPSVIMNNLYFHCTKMRRSSAKLGDESISYRRKKIFDDWDYEFPKDYLYPEVFYIKRPAIVPDPFLIKDNLSKKIAKTIVRIYRKIFKSKEYKNKRK